MLSPLGRGCLAALLLVTPASAAVKRRKRRSLTAGGAELAKPDFETVEIKLPWEADQKTAPLAACSDLEGVPPADEADASLHQALQRFCTGTLARFTEFYVDPNFEQNHEKFAKDGWIDSAYLTYMGLKKPEHDNTGGEEDLLVQSVHHFSEMPIVVANFGKRVPKSWTPERFPNLVLLHARSTAELRKSFNFNKHTAMMFTKIRSGLVLDADQFANKGLDALLRRAAEETTKEYPYPIQPVHWMTRDPEASDMKDQPDGYKWMWKNPEGAPNRTMRWGHAHPTWSHFALPWIAKWTSYVLAPHLYMKEAPTWFLRQGWYEDEDLMNVALWASNATKQWCKFDVPGLPKFDMYMKQEAPEYKIYPDSKFYPKGIPYVYLTAHDAKKPEDSFVLLEKLWGEEASNRKAILYDGQWFNSAEELRTHDPELRCML